MPDSSTSSQGAASGRCGGGRWWPSAGFAVPGSRCGRRAPVRRPRRSCRPATARPPAASATHTGSSQAHPRPVTRATLR